MKKTFVVRFCRQVLEYADIEVEAINDGWAKEAGRNYLDKLHEDTLTKENFKYPLKWEICDGNEYEPYVCEAFAKEEK